MVVGRMKQFEVHHILSGLQSQVIKFHPRTTNIYLTAILVHALHVLLSLVHWVLAKGMFFRTAATKRMTSLPTPYIPLSRSDWFVMGNSTVNSNIATDLVNPIDCIPATDNTTTAGNGPSSINLRT